MRAVRTGYGGELEAWCRVKCGELGIGEGVRSWVQVRWGELWPPPSENSGCAAGHGTVIL